MISPDARSCDGIRIRFDRCGAAPLCPTPLLLPLQDYNCDAWCFEVLETYRRILFVGVLPLLGHGAAVACLGCGLAVVSMVSYRELAPFHDAWTNSIAVIGQYAIFFTFLGAVGLKLRITHRIGLSSTAMGCILLFVNCTILALAAWVTRQRYLWDQKHRAQGVGQVSIEWACGMPPQKFAAALRLVQETLVPAADVMVYHFVAMDKARTALSRGIVASASGIGVLFSLKPHHMLSAAEMDVLRRLQGSQSELASEYEVMLVCTVPAHMLEQVPLWAHSLAFKSKQAAEQDHGSQGCDVEECARATPADLVSLIWLRTLPEAVLRQMRPDHMQLELTFSPPVSSTTQAASKLLSSARSASPGLWHDSPSSPVQGRRSCALPIMPPNVILRAYQVHTKSSLARGAISWLDLEQSTSGTLSGLQKNSAPPPTRAPPARNALAPGAEALGGPIAVYQPRTFLGYYRRMRHLRERYSGESASVLFHYTRPELAPLILQGAGLEWFDESLHGWTDGCEEECIFSLTCIQCTCGCKNSTWSTEREMVMMAGG